MTDSVASSVSVPARSSHRRHVNAKTPLALRPKSAIEIARNAKWYYMTTEKMRVRASSVIKSVADVSATPTRWRFMKV
jgi:hypothetical protein